MQSKVKNIVLTALMAALLLLGCAFCLLSPPEKYSLSERRALEQRPTLQTEHLLSGKFMSDTESFMQDQFPLRDKFRTLKAVFSMYLTGRADNHGLYRHNGHTAKLDYPTNEDSLVHAGEVFGNIYKKYLEKSECRMYLSIIPDKNYFLAESGGYPMMDYDALVSSMQNKMRFCTYADIFGTLSLDSFYRTDPHWKQETLLPTAKVLCDAMDIPFSDRYTEKTLPTPFYGAYCGQTALPMSPDTIRYLVSDTLLQCTVTSYDTGKAKDSQMYNFKKAEGKDPYELFLSGSDALLVVENPNSKTDRELILFRDSFGSSIAPLLLDGYKKVTLVDLRYIQSGFLGSFIDFSNQDVLFLYSALILNSSQNLS